LGPYLALLQQERVVHEFEQPAAALDLPPILPAALPLVLEQEDSRPCPAGQVQERGNLPDHLGVVALVQEGPEAGEGIEHY
jgi:hypothetical protein